MTAASDRVCTKCTPCDRERAFFEAGLCTLTDDRVCHQCAVGEYLPEVGGCTACSTCKIATEYEADSCTGTTDTVCKQQRPECDCTTHFESVAPGPFNNRECTSLSQCDRGSQHEIREPTCTLDRVCSNTTVCVPGQYELKRPTLTSNRQCVECDGETEYQNEANQPACKPMAQCTAGVEFEIPGTKSTNRVCVSLTLCASNEYEAAAPGAFNNRQCKQCRGKCKQVGVEFEEAACTQKGDRVCTKVTACNRYSFQTEGPTQTSDRSCSPHTKCSREEYMQSSGSQWSDAVCSPYTDCNPGTYELMAPTATSDRECRGCNYGAGFSAGTNAKACTECAPMTKVCGPGQLLSPCTEVLDRECRECPSGTFLLPDKSGCKEWSWPCDIGQWESLEPTAVYDRGCTECSPGTFRDDAMPANGGCALHTACVSPNVEIKGKPGSAAEDRACTVGMTAPPATTTELATTRPVTTTTARVLGNVTGDAGSGTNQSSLGSSDTTASFTDDYMFMILLVVAGIMVLVGFVALVKKTKEAPPRIVFDRATQSVALVASPASQIYYTLDGSVPKIKDAFKAFKTDARDPHAVVPLPAARPMQVQVIAIGKKTKMSDVVSFMVPAATPIMPVIVWTETIKPEKVEKVPLPLPVPSAKKAGKKKGAAAAGAAAAGAAATKKKKKKKKKKKGATGGKKVGFKRMGSIKAATTHAGVHSPTQAGGWVGGGQVTYVGPSSHMALELFSESADGTADFAAAAAHAAGADLDHNDDGEAVLGTLKIGVPLPPGPGVPPAIRIYYTTDGSDPVVPGDTLTAGAPFPSGKLPAPVAPTKYYDPAGAAPVVSHRISETAKGVEIRAVAIMSGYEPSPVTKLVVSQLPSPSIKCSKPSPPKNKDGSTAEPVEAAPPSKKFEVILDIKAPKHNGKVVNILYSIGEHSSPLPGSVTSLKYNRKAKPRLTKSQMLQTIKSVAMLEGCSRSKVAVSTLTPPKAGRPTIRCEYGYISIEAAEPESLVYYTLNGTDPILPSFWAIDPTKPQPPTMLYKGGSHAGTHDEHEPSHVHENLSVGPQKMTALTIPRGMPVTIKAVARNPMSSSSDTATLFVMEPNAHELEPPYIVPHRTLAGVELYLEPGDNNPKKIEIYYTLDGSSPYSNTALVYDNDNPHFFRPAATERKYTVKAVTACDNSDPSSVAQTIVRVDPTPQFGQPRIESIVTATGVEVYIKASAADSPSPPPIEVEVEVDIDDDDDSVTSGNDGPGSYGVGENTGSDGDEDDSDDSDIDSAIDDDSEVDVDADEVHEVLEKMQKKEKRQQKQLRKAHGGRRVSFAEPDGGKKKKKVITKVVDAARPDGRQLYYCVGANATPLPGGDGSTDWTGEAIQFHCGAKPQHICIKAIAFGHLDMMQPSIPTVLTISVPASSPPAPPIIALGGECEDGVEVTMTGSSSSIAIYYILGEATSSDLLPENGKSTLYDPQNLPVLAAPSPDQRTDRVLRAVAIAVNAPPSAIAELRFPAKAHSPIPTPGAPSIRTTEIEGQGFDVAIHHAEEDVMDEDVRLFYTIGAATDPVPGAAGTFEFDGLVSSGVFVESDDLDDGFVLVVRAVASRGRGKTSSVTSVREVGIPPEPVFEPYVKPTISVEKTERGLEIQLVPHDPPGADGTGNINDVVLKYNVCSELVPDVGGKMPFIPYPPQARPLLRIDAGATEAIIKAIALEKGNNKRPRSRAAELVYPVEQTGAPSIQLGPDVVFDEGTNTYSILLNIEHASPDEDVSIVYTVDGTKPILATRKSAKRTTTAVFDRSAGASQFYVPLESRFHSQLTVKAAAESRSQWSAPSSTVTVSARQAVRPVVSASVKIETIPLPAPGDPLPFELTAEETAFQDQLQAIFALPADGTSDDDQALRAANMQKGLAATMPRLELMSTLDKVALTDIAKTAGSFDALPKSTDGMFVVVPALLDVMRDDGAGMISFREFLAVCLHKHVVPDIVADVTLHMSSLTEGSEVYYTSDGSAPSTATSPSMGKGKSSVEIVQPLSKGDLVVNAISVAQGCIPSDKTVTTVVVGHVPTPKVRIRADAHHVCLVTMEPGKYEHSTWSTVSEVPNTVFYTLDGSEPTQASNIFTFGASKPIELKIAQPGDIPIVFRARAILPNGVPSECIGMRVDMAAFGYQSLSRQSAGSFKLNRRMRSSGVDFNWENEQNSKLLLLENDPNNPNQLEHKLLEVAKRGKLPENQQLVEKLFHEKLFAAINLSESVDHAPLIDKEELAKAWDKELVGKGNGTTKEVIAAQLVRSGAEWSILEQVDADNDGDFEVDEFWAYANIRNSSGTMSDLFPDKITVNEFMAACGLQAAKKMREAAEQVGDYLNTNNFASKMARQFEVADAETPL